jgi:hypothetical protein
MFTTIDSKNSCLSRIQLCICAQVQHTNPRANCTALLGYKFKLSKYGIKNKSFVAL